MKKNSNRLFGDLVLFTAIFSILKIENILDWSWFLVLLPFAIYLFFLLLIGFVLGVIEWNDGK